VRVWLQSGIGLRRPGEIADITHENPLAASPLWTTSSVPATPARPRARDAGRSERRSQTLRSAPCVECRERRCDEWP
jgi:hypothetical protein